MNDYDSKKPSTFITYLDMNIYMVGDKVSILLMVGLTG